MKKILWILFVLIISSLGFGFFYKNFVDFKIGEKIIGFSVFGGVFIYLPLFLYHRWKGKNLKDYTLSEENLKKMRNKI